MKDEGGRPILEEVVAFPSKRFGKHQEDTAAKGAGIGRGDGEQGRPFTDGREDV